MGWGKALQCGRLLSTDTWLTNTHTHTLWCRTVDIFSAVSTVFTVPNYIMNASSTTAATASNYVNFIEFFVAVGSRTRCTPPLPPTVQQWSQNIRVQRGEIIGSCLCSSHQEMKLHYQGQNSRSLWNGSSFQYHLISAHKDKFTNTSKTTKTLLVTAVYTFVYRHNRF